MQLRLEGASSSHCRLMFHSLNVLHVALEQWAQEQKRTEQNTSILYKMHFSQGWARE